MVPGEAGGDNIDCVYVLLELKSFRDGAGIDLLANHGVGYSCSCLDYMYI